VDRSLPEDELLKCGQHVLAAYRMKPKFGYDYLTTAAHFAAEASAGTGSNACSTDDLTKSGDALVYYIDPEKEEMNIAYSTVLFDRCIADSRAMMCFVLALPFGDNPGLGGIEYGKIYDLYVPPECLRLFDGHFSSLIDMWRILGRGSSGGGPVLGSVLKPVLGLQRKAFDEAFYAFWLGGDFINNDEVVIGLGEGPEQPLPQESAVRRPLLARSAERLIGGSSHKKVRFAGHCGDDAHASSGLACEDCGGCFICLTCTCDDWCDDLGDFG